MPQDTRDPRRVGCELNSGLAGQARQTPALIVSVALAALLLVGPAAGQAPQAEAPPETATVPFRVATVKALQAWASAQSGALVETVGFHAPGDGGGALYRLQPPAADLPANDADVIALASGLVAVLVPPRAVNYRMFGVRGDGENDDGVQIKLAHEFANKHALPVINLSGEYWLKQANSIPIRTNVSWGNSRFHLDERFNDPRRPRFIVMNDEPTFPLELTAEAKATLLARIKRGVQIIPELAQYAGHLIVIQDTNDRVGIRAGYEGNRGWAREEFFYVEEEGRIIGEIAWEFKDFTSVTATPCNNVYLIIEGGGFLVSGDNPEGGVEGYHHNGFSVQRSRTIIRQQWVGLEKGRRDNSLQPRHGFYSLNRVYDVTLEDIRAIPWEKDRPGTDRDVAHGTYGIGGGRMLNCTFRNLTADAGWMAWGVFGTNLNKNFRLENCQLNRIDVHFHCWNLYIKDCTIGFKGISVTGGGDLFIENTTRLGNNFVAFRYDYGARWDGRVRLHGCTLKPLSGGGVSVLSYRLADFDYQSPLGFGRSISIDDLVIDYSAAPSSTAACWLMDIVPFSRTAAGERLLFPAQLEFRNIRVEGREPGVRLLRLPSPQHYDVRRPGGYDGRRLTPNCLITVDNVQLEKLTPERPGDAGNVHLQIGGEAADYADSSALYPKLRFADCDGLSLNLSNCAASVFFERCTLNTVTAQGLQGELVFNNCRFQPNLKAIEGNLYTVESTLGTRFTNCTVHAPVVNGEVRPEQVNQTGFLELNGPVRHYHLNTALGNCILDHCRQTGVALAPEFIAKLKLHHALEN